MNCSDVPTFDRIPVATLPRIVRTGWMLFLQTRPLSVSFSMIFALIGVAVLASITRAQYAPFAVPFAGAFMLIGPLLLAGFFSVADKINQGEACSSSDIWQGFARTPAGVWGVAAFCMLLFVVWMIDAAILYGGMFGRAPQPLLSLLEPNLSVLNYLLLSALTGAVLAFVVFAVSAFSVPLLYYRRAALWPSIRLSIQAVFSNLPLCLIWSAFLALAITTSVLIFPTFLVVFPVLAFASHALYREVFPE